MNGVLKAAHEPLDKLLKDYELQQPIRNALQLQINRYLIAALSRSSEDASAGFAKNEQAITDLKDELGDMAGGPTCWIGCLGLGLGCC